MSETTRTSGYDHRRDDVVSLWNQGLSAPKIAEQTTIPVYRVRILLQQAGVNLSNTAVSHRSGVDQYREQIITLTQQGLNVRQIAKEIDQPYQTVLRWTRTEPGLDVPSGRSSREQLNDEVIRRHLAGDPVKEIAADLGIHAATASTWLHEEGYNPAIAPKNRKVRQTKKDVHLEETLRLHEEGLASNQIAKQVGVHVGTVDNWLRSQGITPRYSRREVSKGMTMADENREEGLRLYQEGVRINEIARRTGAHHTTVHRWIDRAGIRGQGGHVERNKQDAAEVVRLYTEENVGVTQIMEQMHKSHGQVHGWLTEAGVPIKSTWERRTNTAQSDFAEQGKTARLGKVASVETRQKLTSPPKPPVIKSKPAPRSQKPFEQCANSGCLNTVFNRNRKFCSDSCQTKGQGKRQPDPANQVTFNCQTCGKEITRRKTYGHGVNKFCSQTCSSKHTNTVRHYVAREMDMVLDSTWEMTFASACSWAKVPVERFDRTQVVEWRPGNHYGPDFYLPTAHLAVEIKGQEDPDDIERWAAYRATGKKLAVLFREELDEVRSASNAAELLATLRKYT